MQHILARILQWIDEKIVPVERSVDEIDWSAHEATLRNLYPKGPLKASPGLDLVFEERDVRA